jgi:hypothetical protein
MTDHQPDRLDEQELDTAGHALDRAMGLDQLNRPTRAPSGERAEPELPPLTRRFPSMRPEPSARAKAK